MSGGEAGDEDLLSTKVGLGPRVALAALEALERTAVTGWTLHVRGSTQGVPGQVLAVLADGLPIGPPATALAALVRAGLVGDVTADATEQEIAWVSATAWEYRARVPRPPGRFDRAQLVFEGIDTIGRVLVDGTVRCEVADMFRRHVVDLAGGPSDKDAWDVRVHVDPVLPRAQAEDLTNPLPRAASEDLPYNQVRKMACSFGWDWGPVTLAGGLWRPVVLETWSGARMSGVRMAGAWDGQARLRTALQTQGSVRDVRIRIHPVRGSGADRDAFEPFEVVQTVHDSRVVSDVPVPQARPWQPVGLGEQPLYDVDVELRDRHGQVVDQATRRLGFRDVALSQEPDMHGSRFELRVNGVRVWARGFNWIPPHVLPETVTRAHVRHLVTEAVAVGANLLRVWGGGIVESDDFYDICDELGVLVWQDFQFACAAYPEDPATVAQVSAEVADAVARVGHRTSLVLWCGGNENLWGYEDWGWKEVLGDRPWGRRFYHDLIPAALAALDGTRPYIPGSPFSPGDAHPNDPAYGVTHHWNTWNEVDYSAFESMTSRFAAEFGWQGPASWPTLVRALGAEPTGPDDDRLPRLQKANRGMHNLARGVSDHLPHVAPDGRGWFLATQLVQARALRASMGRFRSLHDTCSGALWWQLDDCWPALSWSVLDVAGRRKLAWYAAREVLSPRAALPTALEAGCLTLVNDTRQEWTTRAVVTVARRTGEVLNRTTTDVRVPALGHLVVGTGANALPTNADVVVVDVDGRRGVRWLRPDLELGTPTVRVEVAVQSQAGDGVQLRIRALDLVRDLVVLAETDPRLSDVTVDEQLLTLLPGEDGLVRITGRRVGEVTAQQWAGLIHADGPVDVVAVSSS